MYTILIENVSAITYSRVQGVLNIQRKYEVKMYLRTA